MSRRYRRSLMCVLASFGAVFAAGGSIDLANAEPPLVALRRAVAPAVRSPVAAGSGVTKFHLDPPANELIDVHPIDVHSHERVEPVAIAPPMKVVESPAPVAAEGRPIESLPSETLRFAPLSDDDVIIRKPLRSLNVDIAPRGDVPPDSAAAVFADVPPLSANEPRFGHETLFFWQATNLCHRPLYFEQRYVERYGYSFGRAQPLVSGTQFFATVPLLPLKVLCDPPCECNYTLGQRRPDGYEARRR